MAGKQPCYLFKQTRVNLDWTDKKSPVCVDVHLPKHAALSMKSLTLGGGQKRVPSLDSEEKFKLAQHANAASIYYRSPERFPRCILWRVQEDWHSLSIASVDFTRPDTQQEPSRSFRFIFPEPIQPGSVGFADAVEHDELVIYVLTRGGVLYTLSLTPDVFSGPSRTMQLVDVCKTYVPSAFTLNSPHFLLPVNDRSLVVALRDGSMLKLERQGSSGSMATYAEKTFSDSNYFGYLKLKLPWVGASTVPYRDGTVYHTTAVSALTHIPSPTSYDMEDDYGSEVQPLLFTVSVDHTLKVWSLEQENLLFSTDLLNEPPPTSSKVRTWLDPSPSRLLAVIDKSFSHGHMFYLVSFSSATTGKFKFWAAIQNHDGTFRELEDLYPSRTFEAAPPSGTAPWIISEFRVTPASPTNETLFDLWVLWKSDTNFRIQNIQFDLNDVPSHWNHWATATTDSLNDLPRLSANLQTSEDVTDHWMKWIFYPGRFPDPVLESALLIYENNFVTSERSSPSDPIQVRVGRIVASAVDMETTDRGLPDYEKYRNELDMQWERYARLCTELDKERGEALSLVTDPMTGFVWTINVDGITALRECSETEMFKHNLLGYKKNLDVLSHRTPKKLGIQLQGEQLSDVMLLISAAQELLNSLSESAYDKCEARLSDEVVKEEIYSVGDQMAGVYEYCLYEEVPEETFIAIEEAFAGIREPEVAFQSIMDSLFQSGTHSGSSRLTSFGAKVLVTGSQEMIHVNRQLLFNLILLLLHTDFGEEQPYHRLSNTEDLYHRLIKCFREYEIMDWMARNAVSLASSSADDEISQALTNLQVSSEDAPLRHDRQGSILQLILPPTFGPPSAGPGRVSSVALSLCIRQFLAGLELTDRGNGITNVVAALLRVNAAGTASAFSKFIPSSSWGTYMKARVQLKNRSFVAASQYFHKAAYGMAGGNRNQIANVGIFSNEFELENATGGLARYHHHVSKLFEEFSAPSYVLEFSKAALLSPGMEATLRLEILLQQFRAALGVSLFDDAYLALTRIPNKALQHSAVRELVTAMVEANEGGRLCSYPFVGLQDEVDAALEFKCQHIYDLTSAPPFHKVLYAWRIARGDYRGAATILYERLQRLQTANVGSKDPNSRVVTDAYLALINVLSCVDEDQAWVLSTRRTDAGEGTATGSIKRVRLDSGTQQRREVLTLADLKQGYQAEVERVGLLLNGGFFV